MKTKGTWQGNVLYLNSNAISSTQIFNYCVHLISLEIYLKTPKESFYLACFRPGNISCFYALNLLFIIRISFFENVGTRKWFYLLLLLSLYVSSQDNLPS